MSFLNKHFCGHANMILYFLCPSSKRHFKLDQQIAVHFVKKKTDNVFTTPLLFYATQIINPLLTLKLSANHDKGLWFYPIRESLYSLMIHNIGRLNYFTLNSRKVPIYWLGSYVLVLLPSCINVPLV